MANSTNYSFVLPSEMLIRIFGYLDQRQLGMASAVCSTWAKATIMALAELRLKLNEENCKLLPSWLKQRAQQLQHLQLSCATDKVLVQLPFTNITQLCSLTLQSGLILDHPIDAFSSCQNSLTSLVLLSVVTRSKSKLFSSVAVLRNLRSLVISTLGPAPDESAQDTQDYAEAANSMWRNLKHLTSLVLECCYLGDAALRELTQLKNLQELELPQNAISHPSTLIPLPTGLNYLDISSNSSELDSSKVLAHQSLTALEYLDISCNSLNSPSQLTAVTNLKYLVMDNTIMQRPNQLLSVLSQLSSLEDLSLDWSFCYTDGVEAHDLGRALQLPQLYSLCLGNNRILASGLDHGVHGGGPATSFFAGCGMPHLGELSLHTEASVVEAGAAGEFLCRAEDLQAIANKFKWLRELDLLNRVACTVRADDWLVLRHLKNLTKLAVGGCDQCWQPDDAALKALATLPRLRELYLEGAWQVSEVGLVQLTRLTCLTDLKVTHLDSRIFLQFALGSPGNLHLRSKGPDDDAVWRQVADRLRNTAAFLQDRLEELQRELQAANKRANAAEMRADAAHKRADAAERRADAAMEQVTTLKQQLETSHL